MRGKPLTAAALLAGSALMMWSSGAFAQANSQCRRMRPSCMHTGRSACFLSRHEWGSDPRRHRGWRVHSFGYRNRRKPLHLGQRGYSVIY
jgi:hypothetical protein